MCAVCTYKRTLTQLNDLIAYPNQSDLNDNQRTTTSRLDLFFSCSFCHRHHNNFQFFCSSLNFYFSFHHRIQNVINTLIGSLFPLLKILVGCICAYNEHPIQSILVCRSFCRPLIYSMYMLLMFIHLNNGLSCEQSLPSHIETLYM